MKFNFEVRSEVRVVLSGTSEVTFTDANRPCYDDGIVHGTLETHNLELRF